MPFVVNPAPLRENPPPASVLIRVHPWLNRNDLRAEPVAPPVGVMHIDSEMKSAQTSSSPPGAAAVPGFRATALIERWRQEREDRERRRLRLLEGARDRLPPILRQHAAPAAWIFGSVLEKGAFFDHSDIDLAVEGLPPERYFPLLLAIEAALGTERIDLVEIERCPFADAIRATGERIL